MKKISLIRKLVLFSLSSVLLINVYSNAAIVSDNDGSAFVTKSEFEAMKASFSKQITDYESSITNKIDGAIASYLAGIKVSKEPTNLWDNIKKTVGGPMYFKNQFKTISSTTITPEVNISITRDLCAKGEWGLQVGRRFYNAWNGITTDTSGNPVYTDAYVDMVMLTCVAGTNATDFITGTINRRIMHYRNEVFLYYDESKIPSGVTYETGKWVNGFSLYDDDTRIAERGPTGTTAQFLNQCSFTNKTAIQDVKKENVTGSGTAWIYHIAANGNYLLREYATSIWPVLSIDTWRHDYKDFSFSDYTSYKTYYTDENQKNLGTTAVTTNIAKKSDYGAWTDGTKYEGSSTSSGTYNSCSITQMKANDGLDYSLYQYGTDLGSNISCIRDTATPKAKDSSTEFTATDMEFTDFYFTAQGRRKQTNKFNDMKVNYYKLEQTPDSIDPKTFVQEYATNVAGETVKLGGGCKIVKFAEADQKVKMKIKFTSVDENGNEITSDSVHYMFSDKQFVGGEFATDASIKVEDDATVGEEVVITQEAEKDDSAVWINMYSNTTGHDATMTSFKVSIA